LSVCATVSLAGCEGEKSQVKVSTQPSAAVENGTVFEQARVDVQGVSKVVLPKDAIVRRTHAPQSVQLFMAKQLQFFGHPPAPINLRSARAYLGCAFRKDHEALLVATYGEWGSMEGGASMHLLALVPEGLPVEQRDNLSGAQSLANHGAELSSAGPDGYWYGARAPAKDWTAVPSSPDPEKNAEGNFQASDAASEAIGKRGSGGGAPGLRK
jgi:hypothetical protein